MLKAVHLGKPPIVSKGTLTQRHYVGLTVSYIQQGFPSKGIFWQRTATTWYAPVSVTIKNSASYNCCPKEEGSKKISFTFAHI